ncbi:MAG: dUTP diphosphatase [Nanoarchaeota archaeon]|nr:dUTP diphosphatase [Nanoarchaeota archaeon]
MNIKVKKLHPDAIIPQAAHDSDAGVDLHALEDYELQPGERKLFPTGLSMELPPGYVSLIWPRSGLANKRGIDVLAGVIDAGYRGDYGVILLNTGQIPCVIKKGERIAQLLIQNITLPQFEEVDSLSETDRGEGGFGSSGK